MKFNWRYILLFPVLFFSITAHAESFSSGQWYVSTKNPAFFYAATTSSTNHLLGQYCYINKKTCVYIVGLGINCKQGNEYPGLINSDKAASQVRFVCGHKVGTQNVMYIKKFKDVDRILRRSNEVGFAMPMTEGKFKVVRFSLNGCVSALENMRRQARERMGLGGGNGGNRDSGGGSRNSDEEIM